MKRNSIISGVLAGLCIALGGSVYLACSISYVGALLFCVALLTICYFGFSLYTGKIGFVVYDHTRENLVAVFLGLLGNLIGTLVFGSLIRWGLPNLAQRSAEICLGKLEQTVPQTLIRALFCGVLMYVAVWVFRNKQTVLGIFLCIPVFILSGFEHSIADMFYFFAGGVFRLETALFLALAVLGNTVGGMLIPLLQLCMKPQDGQ